MNNSSSSEAAQGPASLAAFTTPSAEIRGAPIGAQEVLPSANSIVAPPQNVTATAVVGAPPLPQTTGLTAPQRIALQAIAAGQSATDAAHLAGVDRSTLYRWRTHDENFIAALNAWRNHQQDSASNTLLAAAQDAAILVAGVIRKGDVKTALTVLKSLGTLGPAHTGPQTALGVHRLMERDDLQIERDLLKSRVELNIEMARLASGHSAELCGKKDERFYQEQKKHLESLEKSCE